VSQSAVLPRWVPSSSNCTPVAHQSGPGSDTVGVAPSTTGVRTLSFCSRSTGSHWLGVGRSDQSSRSPVGPYLAESGEIAKRSEVSGVR
jgi:hypothetical protein